MHDIRKDDVVVFRDGMTQADFDKITKLSLRIKEGDYDLKYFLQQYLKRGCKFTVTGLGQTEQTKTNYAFVKMVNVSDKEFVVQTRYLNVSSRVAKHPVTKIFLELPKPKPSLASVKVSASKKEEPPKTIHIKLPPKTTKPIKRPASIYNNGFNDYWDN